MPTLVGSVSVHRLEDAGITYHDVRNCCNIQFGNELSFKRDASTNEVQFYAERPERIFEVPNTTSTLLLHGSMCTYAVALTPLSQPHTYLPEPKVVPTRSKKLFLI